MAIEAFALRRPQRDFGERLAHVDDDHQRAGIRIRGGQRGQGILSDIYAASANMIVYDWMLSYSIANAMAFR
jgi:hypothetical protein